MERFGVSLVKMKKDTMHGFDPDLNTVLTIGPHAYRFVPHPLIPDEIYKIPREQATTYQLIREHDQTLWALKVIHVGYRDARTIHLTNAIARYQHLPGLKAANRFCLTKSSYPHLIAHYPSLEHAVIMPWIEGKTWAGFLDDSALSSNYSQSQAHQLALTTAHVLWNLEMHHLVHTDIAGDNVVLLGFEHIELIDLEGCYIPNIPPPTRKSRGWQGYQHKKLDQNKNYRPDGDRFAGAVLLTEMLTWWHPLVRAVTPDECDALFQDWDSESMEGKKRRLTAIRNTLWSINPKLQALFDRAWLSSDLADCPDMGEWTLCLLEGSLKC